MRLRATLRQQGVSLDAVKRRMQTAVEGGVFEAAQHVEGEIRSEVTRTFPRGRTGNLRGSFLAQWVRRGDTREVTAGAFSDLVYARIQDGGGLITPKTGRHLAIPLKKLPVGKWPRHFPRGELFMITSRAGNKLLMRRVSRNKIEPMFLLKRSVMLRGNTPQRHYLDRAKRNAEPGVETILGRRVDIAVGSI